MTNLAIALLALANFAGTSPIGKTPAVISPAKKIADLPLSVPKGWKTEKVQGSTTITPGDVPTGKIYVVMVTASEGKAGSLDEIFEGAKKTLAESGTFKELSEPKVSKSDGGWDYKFVLGTLESGDRGLLAQAMAVKKGDEGGTILVLADGVETMTKYADTFTAMIRGMGAPKTAPVAPSPGKVDLQYTVPPGWVKQQVNGFPLLVKEKKDGYNNWRVSLLIMPTEALSSNVRNQFEGYWKSFVTPNFETTIAPIPLMSRLKSGYACAFDGEFNINKLTTVTLYMIAHGGRVVPVMGIFYGAEWGLNNDIENEVAEFLDTARIPGVSVDKVQLYSGSNLVGDYSESGTSFANYVTRSGAYAGDATISTASYLTIGSDGKYSSSGFAVGAAGNIREKDAGTWSLEDDELVLSKGRRYVVFGYGNDAKAGRFLIISNRSNQKSRLKFTNPRGPLQATWYRAK
ncbi:MAG: hypothetical protein H7Y17_17595 [Chlorobia bacterium]|nr:hypothetical protein [Fimbriimonadaceae bacterium]